MLTPDHYPRFVNYKNALRLALGETTYKSWLEDLSLHGMEKGEVFVGAKSDFFAQQIMHRYADDLRQLWRKEMGFEARVTVRGREKLTKALTFGQVLSEKTNAAAKMSSASNAKRPVIKNAFKADQLKPSADDKSIEDNTADQEQPFQLDPIDQSQRAQKQDQQDQNTTSAIQHVATDLNDAHTFETFETSDSNCIAVSAALSVAEGSDDPLVYFYGHSGLGKSHLLSAIGHNRLTQNANENVLYLPHDNLLNAYVSAVMARTVPELRAYFDKVDVLLVDDIHMLRGRKSTQEELLLLIDRMIAKGKKVILSGAMPPETLSQTGLCQRFTDRLAGGMCVGIAKPDLKLRLSVARSMADRFAARGEGRLAERHVESVARRCDQSIREVQGCMRLMRLNHNAFGDEGMTDDKVAQMISSHIKYRMQEVTLDTILDAVSEVFGISIADMQGKARPQVIVRARHAFNLIARKKTKMPLKSIAAMLNRDHTTIMASVRRAEALAEIDPDFGDKISRLLEDLS